MAALAFAWCRLDRNLSAVVCNNQSFLFRTQLATGERFLRVSIPAGRTFGALVLNFFDAPCLLPAEFAFTHMPLLGYRLGLSRQFVTLLTLLTVSDEQTMRSASNLIWIDLEMTGLKPDQDVVIEIATIVTDSELNTLAEGPVIAIHQSDAILDGMDEWNTTHHNRSGLVDRVKASQYDAKRTEQETIAFLEQWVPRGSSPMCGNTTCQDRRFMARLLPQLEAYFHYRNLDVSTLKILMQRWRPELESGFTKTGTHQALDDIRESINELRYYREHFLRLE